MTLIKGEYNGLCNRSACLKEGAIYYNHSTEQHYCEECAILINKANHQDAMRLFGHELCTVVTVKEEFIIQALPIIPYLEDIVVSSKFYPNANMKSKKHKTRRF